MSDSLRRRTDARPRPAESYAQISCELASYTLRYHNPSHTAHIDPKSTPIMSQEEQAAGLSRKEKRALRDAERSEKTKKGKKRKIEEANEPADENEAYAPELEADFIALPKVDEKELKPTPSGAVSKKRKQAQPKPKEPPVDGEATTTQPATKKRRKTTKAKDGEEGDESTKPANQRFIVFVGNLPYATTDESLRTHFASLQPFTLRHRTDPKTKKSKGFAFLEFENFDRMKTCLKLYHHSYFDPESPEKSKLAGQGEDETQLDQGFRARGKKHKEKGRKINVELTAGGGGGGGERMEKIRVKNVRLEEQRQRRKEAERKEKVRKEKKGGGKEDAPADKDAEVGAGANEGVHPSRLAMMGRR